MRSIVLTFIIGVVGADRFADYNKFPNSRHQNVENNQNRRNEYGVGSSNFYNSAGSMENGYHGRSYCMNRSAAQNEIEMEDIMGMWYAVELVPHLEGSPGIYVENYCVVVHIAETTYEPLTDPPHYHHSAVSQMNWYRQYRRLRLLWDEDGIDLEYLLFFKNDSIGFWNSFGDQNVSGPLAVGSEYRQFTGTVQVLKAVGDHMLLLFCQAPLRDRPPQLFSVLLSREPLKLQRWEIESAHSLLRRKNLSIATRRLLCGNTSENLLASTATLVFASILTLILQ